MKHKHDLALLDRFLSEHGLCAGAGDGKATMCAEHLAASTEVPS